MNKSNIANMNIKELKNQIESLKQVFELVYLVNPVTHKIISFDNDELVETDDCFCIWNKDKVCDKCNALMSIKDFANHVKYETDGKNYYQELSKPVIVNNELYTIITGYKLEEDLNAINNGKIYDDIVRQRDNEIIKILASEYSSVYYIDLTTDELNPYTMNAETESEFGQIFNSGITYSEAFKLYVDRLIYPEDKSMMLENGSIANIKKQLINQKTFITQYRSSDNRYSEMKFVKVGDQYGEPQQVALGFADRDDSIRAEMLRQAEIDRNNEIIEILASEYSSVYYIDLTTDELTPYSMNEETENQFGLLFNDMKYSEAYRIYVDTLIDPEDKSMMLKAGSIGNIMKELRNKKTFLTTYRSYNNGDPHYCEMKFVKVGVEDGTPKAVALGFADKNDELRNRLEQETITKRNTEIIEILASEYSSVYYIDLTTDELDPYTMNEETESEFGHIFRSGIKYSDAFKMYVDTLVYENDKDRMLKAGSIYNILDELHDKKTFITTYRSDNNGDPHYCEMKFVKVGDDDNPQAVALGFADKDEIIRKELEEKEEREKNFEIIDILASEYTSVYYIDLITDDLTTYTMNDKTKEYFEDSFNRGITYSDAFKMYVNNIVADESKQLMLNAGSIENIKKQLRNQKTFITTYLDDENKYCEMKFVKVGGDLDVPEAVALGFSVIDDAYRKELANKQREEFINGLADDYEAVFHVDLDEMTIETVRISDAYLKRNPSLEAHMNYSDYVYAVAANISEEDTQGFIDALSPSNVLKEFSDKEAFFHNYSILKDGEITYYQLKVIHTGDWEHNHNYLIGVHNMDELIKQQVEQEEILEEAKIQAESANVAKSTFLFNMSHDIRTPMNAIMGFNSMAIKNINNPEKLLDCLEKVEKSSQHLLSIINDVLDMARIESGKVNLDETKVIITDSADNLKDIVKESVKDKTLNIVTDYSNIKHNCVFADELRVNRVLMNIINNAIKYTDDGGTVKYTIKEFDSDKPGYAKYEFKIIDNGIGMSEEFLRHVFEAFSRERTSTVSGIQGTGLGMAITKQLIDLMGGTIDIDSKLGEGTTVTINLDFKIADENYVGEKDKEEETYDNLIGKKVLLVEDNELNREIALDILNEFGLEVTEADDGTTALDECIKCSENNEYFDIILMDIQMPKMNGYEATKQIRILQDKKAATTPIVAMTANAFDEDKKLAFDAGMNGHIAKPINIKLLLTTINSLVK